MPSTTQSTARNSRSERRFAGAAAVSTATNPTQEGNHQLKLKTKREELVSKLSDRLPRRFDPRRDPGARRDPDRGRRGRRGRPLRHRPRDGPADRRSRRRSRARARSSSPAACSPSSPARWRRDRADRAARGGGRRRDPQRRLQLPPAGAAGRGLPEVPGAGEEPLKIPAAGARRDRPRWSPAPLARRHAPGPDRGPGQRRRRAR